MENFDRIYNEATLDKTKNELRSLYAELTGSSVCTLRKSATKQDIINAIHNYIWTMNRANSFKCTKD